MSESHSNNPVWGHKRWKHVKKQWVEHFSRAKNNAIYVTKNVWKAVQWVKRFSRAENSAVDVSKNMWKAVSRKRRIALFMSLKTCERQWVESREEYRCWCQQLTDTHTFINGNHSTKLPLCAMYRNSLILCFLILKSKVWLERMTLWDYHSYLLLNSTLRKVILERVNNGTVWNETLAKLLRDGVERIRAFPSA